MANITGTSADDDLWGTSGNDTITGLGGQDELLGLEGNDVLNGGNGQDTLYGDEGNDVLNGGSGDDLLIGGVGSDTYIFGIGSGQDVIDDNDDQDQGQDRLLLGPGISTTDVKLNRYDNHLIVQIVGTSDWVEVYDHFNTVYTASGPISFIQFADGTVWDVDDMLSHINHDGTSGDDIVYGTEGNDSLNGLAGNDYLGGDSGDDILDGGSGDDLLVGLFGDDTYLFGYGSGHDIIEDRKGGYDDRILLAAGITTADVTLTRDEYDLVLHLNATGEQITVAGHFDYRKEGTYTIEKIQFAGGTIWDENDILARAVWAGTDGDNNLYGTAGNDVLNGLGGNDSLFGLEGNDTLDGGTGSDYLEGGAGKDTLRGANDTDSLYGQNGNDTLKGGGGNDNLSGGTGNDKLNGDAGNDILVGDGGADTFIFSSNLDAATNVDTIEGYRAVDDTIQLDNAVFALLTATGALNAAFFRASATGDAVDADDYILYETDTGMLFYDADGSGAGTKVQFALIGSGASHAALTAGEFIVI